MVSPSNDTNDKGNSESESRFPNVEREQVKRERQNATKYRRLYSTLLSKHEGLLQDAWGGGGSSNEDTTEAGVTTEASLLQKMWISERNAMATGFVVGCSLFAGLRFMTPVLVRRIGGEAKMQALRQADEEAKRLGTYKYQRAFAWIVEGGLSFWLASRVYNYQSKNHSENAYETLAKVPLCSGQSVISDKVCKDWVDITAHQIPKQFWKNLDRDNAIYKELGPIQEERAWRSIIQFSNNCIMRSAFERALREKDKEEKDAEEEKETSPISLPTDVPHDVALSASDAAQIVVDLPR